MEGKADDRLEIEGKMETRVWSTRQWSRFERNEERRKMGRKEKCENIGKDFSFAVF